MPKLKPPSSTRLGEELVSSQFDGYSNLPTPNSTNPSPVVTFSEKAIFKRKRLSVKRTFFLQISFIDLIF